MAQISMGRVPEHYAASRGGDVALVYGNEALTWRELAARIECRAHGLRSLGVEAGDTVTIALPNGTPFLETTYAALRLGIETWRWAGVPFLVRTGKRLAATATAVYATLREPPQRLFDEAPSANGNYLRLKLGPGRVAIALGVRVKQPGERIVGRSEELLMCDETTGGMSAYERLNATFRERLASLTRRGRALARRTLTLQHGMYLIGTVYNFCTPHARLPPTSGGTTPAMAAGITDHCWTVHALLSLHVPPPRWTPTTALTSSPSAATPPWREPRRTASFSSTPRPRSWPAARRRRSMPC